MFTHSSAYIFHHLGENFHITIWNWLSGIYHLLLCNIVLQPLPSVLVFCLSPSVTHPLGRTRPRYITSILLFGKIMSLTAYLHVQTYCKSDHCTYVPYKSLRLFGWCVQYCTLFKRINSQLLPLSIFYCLHFTPRCTSSKYQGTSVSLFRPQVQLLQCKVKNISPAKNGNDL